MELNPGFTKLPSVQHTDKRGRCADCNRGTGLLWSSQGVQDYRLCQSCAKRRGPPYSTAIRIHLGGKYTKMICDNCGYDIRSDTQHRQDGEGHCLIIDNETQQVRGAANRKQPRDMYRKK